MTSLLISLGVALAVLGLALAVVNWFWPAPPREAAPDPRWLAAAKRAGARFDKKTWTVIGIAAALGFFLSLFTHLLIYFFVLPGAVVLLRMAFGAVSTTSQIDKLAQMELWTRSLSGLITAGASLENALTASVPNAGPLIREDISRMVARIRASWGTTEALKHLGYDLADQTGDLIVMHLSLAARQRGPGLAASLDDLAAAVEEEVSKRRAIVADRAGARREARIVIVFVVAALCVIPAIASAGGPMAGYQTPQGQFIFMVLAIITACLIVWMTRVVAPQPQTRLLTVRSSA